MFLEQFSRNSAALPQAEDDAKYFLYFDHSDDLPDTTLSIKTDTSIQHEHLPTTSLHRYQYLSILNRQYSSPVEVRRLMGRFIRNQRDMRRERAKERVLERKLNESSKVKIEEEEGEEREEDKLQKDKRKKRLSAQISRDRKKTYLKRVQEENANLKIQLQKMVRQKNNLSVELERYKRHLAEYSSSTLPLV